MKNKEFIDILIQKVLDGQANDQDFAELTAMLAGDQGQPYADRIQVLLSADQRSLIGLPAYNEESGEIVIQNILHGDKGKNTAGIIHRIHFLKTAWFRWAAAAIILFGIGTYIFSHTSHSDAEVAKTTIPPILNDVMPGSERAILTVSTGEKIQLNNAASETIQDGILSIKNTDGRLTYEPSDVSAINTMATPTGGQYQLVLADGTKAWLNAASSITYPTAFKGAKREVTITGEVYFEVAKNKSMPFIVHAGDQQINVLGTSFNVNLYDRKKIIKTTLIEGSIKIGSTILKPGNAFDGKKIIATNIQQDIAWKNGRFDFNHVMIGEAMEQLSRWYNIEVVYPKGIPDIEFAGGLKRTLTLKEVLKILEQSEVKFALKGNQLTVTP